MIKNTKVTVPNTVIPGYNSQFAEKCDGTGYRNPVMHFELLSSQNNIHIHTYMMLTIHIHTHTLLDFHYTLILVPALQNHNFKVKKVSYNLNHPYLDFN